MNKKLIPYFLFDTSRTISYVELENAEKQVVLPILLEMVRDKYHFFLSLLGSFLYFFPSKKIKVIGVTGTNGKSTTIELITKILEEAGFKVAALSSIKFKIGPGEKINDLRMTMPGKMILQKFLKKAVKAKCHYAILEVTSEGIKQHRHRFIDFDCAVFTNLSPEHIEAHKGFENYKKAKGKFFQAVKNVHIINIDDENADYFLQFPAEKKYGYGFGIFNSQFPIFNQFSNSNLQTVIAKDPQTTNEGTKFSLKKTDFNLKLLGKFNIHNALAAICVGLSQGIDLETCQRALSKVKGIPGRMELVIAKPFKVFVDYAFTPNALEQVYSTLANLSKYSFANISELKIRADSRKMICVLGACGGGRDKWKRPVLGKLAAKYCDKIIITNEDPYDENPLEIIEQIAKGTVDISINQLNQHKSAVYKILDRRKAIRKALESAKPNDTVIITGKGCEPSICLADGKKIPWDDRRIVRGEFQKLKKL